MNAVQTAHEVSVVNPICDMAGIMLFENVLRRIHKAAGFV